MVRRGDIHCGLDPLVRVSDDAVVKSKSLYKMSLTMQWSWLRVVRRGVCYAFIRTGVFTSLELIGAVR